MRIVPAIDIIDGKCVRLEGGDYSLSKVYHTNPFDVARAIEDAGLEYLHLVDLDGARTGSVVNWDTVKAIQSDTRLKVDFGGGVSSSEIVSKLIGMGISQVNIGTLAVREPEQFITWLGEYGAERMILSADVRAGCVAVSGWQQETAVSIDDLVSRYLPHGLRYVTCTDISVDGTLSGPALGLYAGLRAKFPGLFLTASGGVSSIDDLRRLAEEKVEAAIVGKALYEGKVTLAGIAAFMKKPRELK